VDVAYVDELDDGAGVDGAAVLGRLRAGEVHERQAEIFASIENERGGGEGGAGVATQQATGGVHCAGNCT
jgi:hypothetical protein